jgi:oligosaccharide reducing-end xylanase
MKIRGVIIIFSLFISFLPLFQVSCSNNKASDLKTNPPKAYFTGSYVNLFKELLDLTDVQVQVRLDSTYTQLFYGNDETQRVYYPVEPDMAYIKDILNNDVRSEGMSYGMMITVQLNKKQEFDRIWKWAKTYMQHQQEPAKNYFAWHCKTDGSILDPNSAPDGEEWFVMSLFFAAARWGNGEGIYNYRAEAQTILDAMLSKTEESDRADMITNMFNKNERQVVFVPAGHVDDFTDPSYHLPHFYELWALWADKQNQFWCEAAITSRRFFKKAVNPVTGLAPDYANFDGTATDPPWGGGHRDFRFDAWRVAANIAVDYSWFAADDWAVTQSNRLLNFFQAQGVSQYGNQYTLDGKKLDKPHSAGLVAMNAVACLAATDDARRRDFIQDFWNTPVPSGLYRYYDGLLYMLGLLQVSGNFRIYSLSANAATLCTDSLQQ